MKTPIRWNILWAAPVFFVLALHTRAAQPPASPVSLDVNDVSFLWPPPATRDDVAALIAADTPTSEGSQLWPAQVFTAVLQAARQTGITNLAGTESRIDFTPFQAQFEQPATWKLAGFRVDPSAPGGHPSLVARFGSVPQIRLVMQPVTVDASGRVRAHDVAVHLVYSYITGNFAPPFTPDRERFGAIVADLQALKAAAGLDTGGKLGVHPALNARVAGFGDKVRAFLAKHVSASRLLAVSFMGIEPPEPWIFFAMTVRPDGTLAPASQAVLGGGHIQMLTLLSRPRAWPVPSVTNVDAAAGQGVSTGVLFTDDIATKLDTPAVSGRPRPLHRDIPDLVANPQRAHFFNTDCVSCHTESTRRRALDLPAGDGALRFATPDGISGVDDAVVPGDIWNTRNFGWFQRRASDRIAPTVTMRTANEAAESVEVINRDYLHRSPSAGAAPPRVLLASLRPPRPSLAHRPRGDTTTMPRTVANPLTLVMNIKSPEDHRALKALVEGLQGMPPDQNPIVKALTRLRTVHFARFVFLSEQQLAVMTTYDGSFEDYIDAFVNAIGGIFDKLLAHMKDAPPLPVSDHRDEFLAYVRKHDLGCVQPFYSAYPELTVQDVLTLQKQHGQP